MHGGEATHVMATYPPREPNRRLHRRPHSRPRPPRRRPRPVEAPAPPFQSCPPRGADEMGSPSPSPCLQEMRSQARRCARLLSPSHFSAAAKLRRALEAFRRSLSLSAKAALASLSIYYQTNQEPQDPNVPTDDAASDRAHAQQCKHPDISAPPLSAVFAKSSQPCGNSFSLDEVMLICQGNDGHDGPIEKAVIANDRIAKENFCTHAHLQTRPIHFSL